MSPSAECRLVGSWRIVEADRWDRDHLDLCGPATITIGTGNRGEIAFGALQAALDLGYGRSTVSFDWRGDDDLHDVWGDGFAELLDDGSMEITFTYDGGDEAILKAVRVEPSAPASDR